MSPNLGNIDRIVRALVGIVLVVFPFMSTTALFQSGMAQWISVLVGVVLLATSSMRFCPAYSLLGLRTCKDC